MKANIRIYSRQRFDIMITKKQLENISNLSVNDQAVIVDHCARSLGLMTISEYATLVGRSKKTIYRNVDSGKIPCITICETKYIPSNVNFETL